MAFTPITITASYLRADGAPARGTVTATLSGPMRNGNSVIDPTPISAALDAANATTAVPSSVLASASNPAFRYLGTKVIPVYGPGWVSPRASGTTSANFGSGLPLTVEFGTFADRFEIVQTAFNQNWRIRVDGQLVASGQLPADNPRRRPPPLGGVRVVLVV